MIQSQLFTRILRKSNPALIAAVVAIGLLASASPGLAITMTWTNGSALWTSPTAWTTNLFTGLEPIGLTNSTCSPTATSNVTATCVGGNGSPASGDTANFTNNTSYTVTVNTSTNVTIMTVSNTAGIVTMDAGANTLTVATRFRIAESDANSTAVWAGGTLSVGGTGAAKLQVAPNSDSFGAFIVTGGTVLAGGSLNMGGSSLTGTGRLVISGSGVFTNANAPNLALAFRLRSAGCQLIVTNGGKFFWPAETRAISNSMILVSDPGSLLYCTNVVGATACLSIGYLDAVAQGPGSLLIVSNGATVYSDGTVTIGRGGANPGQFTAFSTGLVVRAGKLIAAGDSRVIIGTGSVGGSASNNLTVYDGGYFECDGTSVTMGNSAGLVGNSFNMGGKGAMSTGLAVLVNINSTAVGSRFVVTNAVFTCTRVAFSGTSGNSVTVLANGTLNLTGPIKFDTTNNLTISSVNGGTITINAGTINAAVGRTNVTSVSIGTDTSTGNSLIVTNGGNLFADNITVQGTNSIVFTSGTISTGGMTIQSNANNDVEFVVGNGVNAAYYDMATGGSGFHRFRTGGTPDLVITNGAFLRGSGTFTGSIKVLGTFVPGFANAVGSIFSSNSVTFGSSAVLNYDLGTNSDSVTIGTNTTLFLAGTLNVQDSGGFTATNYTLFTLLTDTTVTTNTLTVNSLPAGFTAVVSNDVPNGKVLLVVSAIGGGDPYNTWATTTYGLSGGNAAGTADPDGDGMSNTNEFLAGFNPTSSAAYLHIISVTRTATTNITVTYLGASGDSAGSAGPKTNVLDFTTGGTGGNYSNNFQSANQTNILTGGTGLGGLSSFVDTNGAIGATRYYRVRVLVP